MKKLRICLVAGCLLIASCSRHVTIAMYGDSTTWGNTLVHGVYEQSPMNPPAELQRMFSAIPDNRVVIENHGIRGATCLDFLWGAIGGASDTWDAEMRDSRADIIVMNIGINDVLRKTDARVPQCYRKMAAIAKTHGKTFVIETPNPVALAWNDAVGVIAKDGMDAGLPVIDQWTAVQNIPHWQRMLPDGIHPNDALYRSKAMIAFPALTKLSDAALSK